MAPPKPLLISAAIFVIIVGLLLLSYFGVFGNGDDSVGAPKGPTDLGNPTDTGNPANAGNSTVPGNPTKSGNSTDTGKHPDTGKKSDSGKQTDHGSQGNPEKNPDNSNSHSNIASRSFSVQNDVVQDLILKQLKGYKIPPPIPEADDDLD